MKMPRYHEIALIKTLLGLVNPCQASYVGHAQRMDKSFGVIVRTAHGLKTLTISLGTLILAQEGILVEQDRFAICAQLDQPVV